MASVASRCFTRATAHGLRNLAIATTSGFAASAMILTYAARHKTPSLIPTAKCMCRAPPLNQSCFPTEKEPEDLPTQLENWYQYGHLTDIYETLNKNNNTSTDPQLLFHLARATYKLGLASPHVGRQKALNDEALLYIGKAMQLKFTDTKLKADLHALYAIVLHNKGKTKENPDKMKYLEAAQQHLTAALKDDRQNFLANYAFAEMSYEKAKAVVTPEPVEVKKPSFAFSFFRAEDANQAPQPQEIPAEVKEKWREVCRYARRAVNAQPNDVQSINLMAQAKYAMGDLAEAKRFTVLAQNRATVARFADEKKASRESRQLMEKINAELDEQHRQGRQ